MTTTTTMATTMTTDYGYDPMDLHFLDPANRTSMGSHIDGKCLFFTARDRIHSASQPEPVDASNTQQTRSNTHQLPNFRAWIH